MANLKDLREKRCEILKAELAAWLHDVEKAGISKSYLPKVYLQWLEASNPSSLAPWISLDLWLLAQTHGIAHFDKQEPNINTKSSHIDGPFGYPLQKSEIDQKQKNKWLNNLKDKKLAYKVLSSCQADTRYPINEVDLWSWGTTTGALNKGAWLNAIFCNNMSLNESALKQSMLQGLDNKRKALFQREDFLKKIPEKRFKKIFPDNFSNLHLFGVTEEGETQLTKFLQDVTQWLKDFRCKKFDNRLTQKHWEEFFNMLVDLHRRIEKISSLLQWRLLSIRTNGLEYLLSVSSIPDLKARQELLKDAWDKVKNLLEEEYPLALEVYRDENGSVFVVPDIDNLLGLTDSDRNAQTLREFILERFRQGTVQKTPCLALQGEIVPTFKLDSKPWKGQPAPQELPPIGEHVGDEATCPVKSDPQWVAAQWCNLPRPQERCTVCSLRPQGPGKKALDRNVCNICEERRADRSKEWATSQTDRTIWTDEVADANARLALILGQFDLTHWLDGTLVCSLAVRIPNDQNGHTEDKVAKNPSFARLRRIWETTRNFWQEVLPTYQDRNLFQSLVMEVLGLAGPRLEIRGTLHPQRPGDTLGPYHAYELVLPRGVRLSVVWDEEKKRFITADNLDYLSSDRQLGRPVQDVLQSDVKLTIEEPSGYGAKNKVWGTITIQNFQELPNRYLPAIPILAEPRTFMALVPTDKSLELIKHIKNKYEDEMGKVRNRLPLHLGCIYAHRHTPIRALLDAGRAMLSRPRKEEQAEVKDVTPRECKDDNWPTERQITLCLRGREIRLTVPTMMGDNTTPDLWYPYWRVEGKATNRTRWFIGPEGKHWVHVCDLKQGDIVHLSPSSFDFEYLDTTARRFEIHYDKEGRRPRRTRPFYLEDLDRLEELWTHMKNLKRAQRYQVIHTIEATREAWYGQDPDGQSTKDEVFKRLVADTLAQAEWKEENFWNNLHDDQREELIQAGMCGELADLAELHMEILKEKE